MKNPASINDSPVAANYSRWLRRVQAEAAGEVAAPCNVSFTLLIPRVSLIIMNYSTSVALWCNG